MCVCVCVCVRVCVCVCVCVTVYCYRYCLSTSPAGVPEISPRQIDVKATLTFATTSCENKPVIVGAVRMLVADYFMRLAQVWAGLCDDPSCGNVMSDVIQGCEGGYVRRKRQFEEMLVVSILVANVS